MFKEPISLPDPDAVGAICWPSIGSTVENSEDADGLGFSWLSRRACGCTSYDRWLRAKVQASLNDPRPNVPHDQVMADMRALIESKRNKHDAG